MDKKNVLMTVVKIGFPIAFVTFLIVWGYLAVRHIDEYEASSGILRF